MPFTDDGGVWSASGSRTAAVATYLDLRFPPPTATLNTGRVLDGSTAIAAGRGIGSTRTVTGRLLVATDASDAMSRVEPGDILACAVTNPAFNVVFPVLAGAVTSVGGLMGHTAVTARELGIPAVVGVGDLEGLIDGSTITIEVD